MISGQLTKIRYSHNHSLYIKIWFSSLNRAVLKGISY
jgi:hypothetical protein